MRHLVFSEAGHNHVNEDFARAQFHPYDAGALICVLADGQGGQFGGGRAARVAVQQCFELALARAPSELWREQTWLEIVRDAAVEADPDAGFTTLIALCANDARICGASCGDGATWLVEAAKAAELTAAQRKNPPVGSGGARPVAFAAARSFGATLLLMSDGAWKFVEFERAARVHRGASLIEHLRALQLTANGGKLPDDFTVVTVW